jgi:predicted RNase H-like HicB family nuclease
MNNEQNYNSLSKRREFLKPKMTMMYWKSNKFWLGKLIEHPEIMTQGETLEELEENIKEAYHMLLMADVKE